MEQLNLFHQIVEQWFLLSSILFLIGLGHALHALLNVRTSQGAIAWTLSLLFFPYIAVPLYWVFGRNKFRGYVDSRIKGRKKIHHLAEQVVHDLNRFCPSNSGLEKALFDTHQKLSGLPPTTGNKVTLLINGEATFSEIFKALASAKEYILVQFFIVKGDRLGSQFKEELLRKASEGVRIYFMYDEYGSRKLSRRFLWELKRAGVQVATFRTSRGKGNPLQINFRNHRKITIIDGKTAFVGGLNLGDEYLGRDSRFGPWRDTHLKLQGPSVQAAQLAYLEDWYWARNQIPELNWEICAAGSSNGVVQILPTGPADILESCQLSFFEAINLSRKRFWITSPYFVPDPAIVSALQAAALRGVDVRILLPQNPDHLIVFLSSYSYYSEMLQAGVKLYRYPKGFMHQKVLLVDDLIAAVGTANIDNRSFRLNFEIIAYVCQKAFVESVEKMLIKDFKLSQQAALDDYSKRTIPFKLLVRLARLLSPIQ